MTIQRAGAFYNQGFGTSYEQVEIPYIAQRDPTAADGISPQFPVGKRWINTANSNIFTLIGFSSAGGNLTANWKQESGTNTFPITPYVVGPAGQAGYQTIQSAINAANAAGGGIVYVQPGRYYEDLIMYGGVSIVGSVQPDVLYNSDSVSIIQGTVQIPESGYCSFSYLQFNSDQYVFFIPTSSDASISVQNCSSQLVQHGNTFVLSDFTGNLYINNLTTGNGASDGVVRVAAPNGGFYTILIENSFFQVNETSSFYCKDNGYLYIYNTYALVPFEFPFDMGVISNAVRYFFMNSYILYINASDQANGQCFNCIFDSRSNSAITLGMTSFSTLINCSINSNSSYNAIEGNPSSNLRIANLSFTGSNSTINNSLTIIAYPSTLGDLSIRQGNLSLLTDGATLKLYNGGTSNSAIGVSPAVTSGTVTVPCTIVTANSFIWLQNRTVGTSTLPTSAYVSNITPGVSFDIVTSDPTDNISTYQYWVMNTIQP